MAVKTMDLRQYVSDALVTNMVLPAITVAKSPIPVGHGKKKNAAEIIAEIRNHVFTQGGDPHHPHAQQQWINVTLPGDSDDVLIDAAFWINPAQLARDPSKQAWILFCLANGEVSGWTVCWIGEEHCRCTSSPWASASSLLTLWGRTPLSSTTAACREAGGR
jgi:hypothetical protein